MFLSIQRPPISYKELRNFAFKNAKKPQLSSSLNWCEPFPCLIPAFPVRQRVKLEPRLEEEGRSVLIPSHLPPFPPKYTYSRTSKRKEGIDNSTEPMHSRKRKLSEIDSVRDSLAKIESEVVSFPVKKIS